MIPFQEEPWGEKTGHLSDNRYIESTIKSYE
jgi:hypothetical protein